MTFDIDLNVAEAWGDDGSASDSYASAPQPARVQRQPGAVAVRAPDLSRRRHLESLLDGVPEEAAGILVLDIPTGESVPRDLGRFDGAVIALSDDVGIAADRGLAAVLPRMVGPAQIRAAVSAVAQGLWVRVALAAEPRRTPPFGGVDVDRSETPTVALTPREREILTSVGDGLSNKEIARRLSISAHTVKFHLEAIFAKLVVRTRAEAVRVGLRHGLLKA